MTKSQYFKFFLAGLCFLGLAGYCIHPAFASSGLRQLIGEETSVPLLVSRLYKLGLGLLAVAALVMIVIGGYQYLTSFGNASQIGEAKTRIYYALGGLILGLVSYLILGFINRDFVEINFNPSEIQEEMRQAMENLKAKSGNEAAVCASVTDKSDCSSRSGKKIGDVCSKNNLFGYCSFDPNTQSAGECFCDTGDPCANNCHNGNKNCIKKKCATGGQTGFCVGTHNNAASQCLDLEEVCERGSDCGATAKTEGLSGVSCSGLFACKKGGEDGFCLQEAAGLESGAELCKSLTDVCVDRNCGMDFSGEGRDKLVEACFNHACGSDKTKVCVEGGCQAKAPNNQCGAGAESGQACQLGSIWGTCQYPANAASPGQLTCVQFVHP